ncbi:unnamed protein product [Adineta ricciae]|uniref:Endonuclease/exonuclease/phosphatase domain-containing protein n=1 Tax=Adineta ricciae TaxID=249248 RepID=A0A814NJK8_ADIRI|nr:unnamed protein product [Adineta ricciae]
MTIRIVSYNILVPIYASLPYYYHKSERRYLETDYRWNLTTSQLKQEINDHENTIICLQELSRTLISKCEEFFRELNYTFYYDLYGQIYNNYMGVGIAVPPSIQITHMSMLKISDHIRSLSRPRETLSGMFSWIRPWYNFISGTLVQSTHDPWETAMSKNNTLICLQVTVDDKSLCIGVYHMPCLYKTPDVMMIHASIVKDLMFKLADGKDFILAGDFNIEPHNSCYNMLTGEDVSDYKFPVSSSYEIFYQLNSEQVLKSAYREKNGQEPSYTNYSNIIKSSIYCGTLDYIFYRGDLTVQDVLDVPERPASESYPDETHPSDHLMIAGTFRLK